ncbi:MAG: hypothetical protein H6621_02250 [Halobacteriovoraceae bacterium]|nr:hypothetical protein [Halobacteriovoraceae bacterium]MCB9093865.1 hypothetical protein [Halobacteriovoraceae bacterium]
MKVAVVGTGKTGSEVEKLVSPQNLIGPFNSRNPVSVEKLKEADTVVVFVNPLVLSEIIDTLLASEKNVIIGTTGFEFTDEIKSQVSLNNSIWVHGANFSLGMQIMRMALESVNSLASQFDHFQYKIHEIHHEMKKDIPSGTALMWNEFINKRAEVSSERKGDVKGYHELTIESESEVMTLTHLAKSRRIFAEGALWCADYIYRNFYNITSEFYSFNQIMDMSLTKEKIYGKTSTVDSDSHTLNY